MGSTDTSPLPPSDPDMEAVLEVFQAGLPFRETVDAVLQTLTERQGWQATALWMPDHHGRAMICAGTWAAHPEHEPFVRATSNVALPIDHSTIGRCWATAEVIWIEDVALAEGFRRRDLVLASGLRTVLFIPVVSGESVVGVLELLGRRVSGRERHHATELERILPGLAALLETQIEGEQMRRQQQRLDLALSAGRMGTWEWDRRTGQVSWSPLLEQIYGFEPGSFPGTMEAYQSRIHPDDRAMMREALEETVAAERDHHVLHRVLLDDGEVRWVEAHGRPLTLDGIGFIGLTGVATDVTERERLLADLARQVELTEQALADRTHVADTLQRSLLPDHLPQVDGLRLASGFRPGRELVGGDFYDISCADEDVYLCLGDICGSGPEVAWLTGLVRYTIRGMVAAGVVAPTEILHRVNELLLAEDIDNRFVSVVLARLVPAGRTWQATICRAGHPLPLIRAPDGSSPVLLDLEPGAVLGAFEEVHLTDQVVELAPGALLLLYTDGVTEARRGGELFGEERLLQTLGGVPADAKGSVRAVLAALDAFDSGDAPDDVALLAVAVDR